MTILPRFRPPLDRCLALASLLRLSVAILSLFGILASGCGADGSDVEPDAGVSSCGGGCEGGCGAGERCLGGSSPASLYSFAARCARTCTSTTDCAEGLLCLSLAG